MSATRARLAPEVFRLPVDRIREGVEVPVFVDRTVSPSYTPDIARATRALVERSAPRGLYHCVNTGHASWAEIAGRAAAILDVPLHMRPLWRRAERGFASWHQRSRLPGRAQVWRIAI